MVQVIILIGMIMPFNIESEIKTRLSGVKDYEPFIQIKKRKY